MCELAYRYIFIQANIRGIFWKLNFFCCDYK